MPAENYLSIKSANLRRIIDLLKNPGFWIVFLLLVLISIPHYREALQHPVFLNQIMLGIGMNRHAFERILYLAPIIFAGFFFGFKGTIVTSGISLLIMLPRVFFITADFRDALFETISVFLIGNIIAVAFMVLKREKAYGRHLSVLDQMASAVSQSLELEQVLDAAIDSVMKLMNLDAAFIYLVDEDRKQMNLAAFSGVSNKFIKDIDGLKIGEGLNGAVALSGREEYVEDALTDPRLTKVEAVRLENLHSEFIVPLKSKGVILGTLCLIKRSKYRFKKEEIETALAVGNSIGVAVANARVYEKEKTLADKLKESEERYRNLFENAHDAIWLQDFYNNIITANRAFARLTGYSVEDLCRMKDSDLLSPESMKTAKKIHDDLLLSMNSGSTYELKITKKDGNDVLIQLSTSILFIDDKPQAFQYIARDITVEKRMQENLRFYLNQVTRAQEEERSRVARELHDDTIQSLVVLSRQIDEITYNKTISPETRKLLSNLRDETGNIMAGVRRLSQDLRPPTLDKLGLIPALEWLVTNIENLSGISIKFSVTGTEKRLSEEAELTMYRIIQEALQNIWKHSGASNAEVAVDFLDNMLRIVVRDNGKGLELSGRMDDLARFGKLGLAGIRERTQLLGGNIEIESNPGNGTLLKIEVPE